MLLGMHAKLTGLEAKKRRINAEEDRRRDCSANALARRRRGLSSRIAPWGSYAGCRGRRRRPARIFVDFASLRDSVKAEVSATFVAPALDKGAGQAYAGLGAVLAGAMIGPMVDAMVTPAGIANMVRQGRPRLEPRTPHPRLRAARQTPVASSQWYVRRQRRRRIAPEQAKPTMGYDGIVLRRLVSVPRERWRGCVRLVFRHDGLDGSSRKCAFTDEAVGTDRRAVAERSSVTYRRRTGRGQQASFASRCDGR
jgi:hypothetical protein